MLSVFLLMCLSLFPVWACMSLRLWPCLPLSKNYVNSFGLHIPLIILLCVSPACLLPSLCEIVCVLLFPVLLWQCRVLCWVCIVLLPLCCQSNLLQFWFLCVSTLPNYPCALILCLFSSFLCQIVSISSVSFVLWSSSLIRFSLCFTFAFVFQV